MKLTVKLLALLFGVLMLGTVANAESPREQLNQMVAQLQKSPTDNALREKIIKLAQELKPAPAVPEEAIKYEGRGQFAFSHAKSTADYLDAAKEYEKAVAAAPWVPGYYADLCTIYEKAEKYAEAKKNCEFFLASSPSAQDASDVRKRIAGLEFAMEKAAAEAAAKRTRFVGEWVCNEGAETLVIREKTPGVFIAFFIRIGDSSEEWRGRLDGTRFIMCLGAEDGSDDSYHTFWLECTIGDDGKLRMRNMMSQSASQIRNVAAWQKAHGYKPDGHDDAADGRWRDSSSVYERK